MVFLTQSYQKSTDYLVPLSGNYGNFHVIPQPLKDGKKTALPGGVQRDPSEQTPSPQLSHTQLGAYFWFGFSNGL